MPTITFQFSTTSGLIDDIIRLRTDSDISHIDVITPDGKLLGAQLHETDGDGVLVREPGYDKFTKTITVVISVTQEQYDSFWKFAYAQVGKPYDEEAIAGLALHRDWRKDGAWFCSELQGAGLEQAKIIVIATEVNWLDPQTLLVILCDSSHFVSKTEQSFQY